MTSKLLLEKMKNGDPLSMADQTSMIIRLSIPAILAQISTTVMEYIDASMVGQLGSSQSASIGLVASATWLFGGLCSAAASGFNVRIAHCIGARDDRAARNFVRTGLVYVAGFGTLLMILGAALSFVLPALMGGEESIRADATAYFLIFSLSMPFYQLNIAAVGMLQCSGNMKLPGIMEILMCVFDVVFNFFLIFPARIIDILGMRIEIWGAGLGVAGAALGTALSEVVVSVFLLGYLLLRSDKLRLRRGERAVFSLRELWITLRISIPVAIERIVTCSSYIAFARIVSPLGTVAIAAHSFSITAEGLCYMPGYGIGMAATTVIGQSIGARRSDLTKRLGRLSVWLGVIIMTVFGALMYIFAPQLIGLLSPDAEIREIGAAVLRIEAFAEPLFAASIVATGVFRGAGDTAVSSALNFISMWAVRIPLAYALSLSFGLRGVWTAMCIELCFRGALFIILMETRFRRRADSGMYRIGDGNVG